MTQAPERLYASAGTDDANGWLVPECWTKPFDGATTYHHDDKVQALVEAAIASAVSLADDMDEKAYVERTIRAALAAFTDGGTQG